MAMGEAWGPQVESKSVRVITNFTNELAGDSQKGENVKAPNVTWSGLFFLVVVLGEQVFGSEVVATQGAGVVAVLASLLKLWQEYQAEGTVHTMTGTRGAGASGPGFVRRVFTQ